MGLPRRCVFGCGNSNTLFAFPPKESKPWLRRKWLEFIHFDEGIILDNSRLCDRHFIDDCFTNKGMFTAGLASCLLLSENPIPSLYTVGESPDIKCTTTRNIGCQTDHPQKKSVGTQCQIKDTYFRSKATQTRLRPESVGTPVHWNRPPSLLNSIYPEPSKKRRLTLDDDNDDDDGDSIEVTETYFRNQDTQTYTDTESFEPSKRRRLTLDDDDEYDGDSIEVTLSKADVPRYVVREDSLLQLFKECPMCGSLCEVQKTTRGTLLLVVQLCPQCSFSRKWRSPQTEKMASKRPYKTIGADVWMSRLRTFAASGVWPSEVGNRPSSKQPKWHSLYLKIEKCAGLLSGRTTLSEGPQSCVCGFHSVKSVTSGDAFSSTNDPENSATAITEIIGLSDESASLDEGSREVDEGGHNSDSSDEGQNEEVDDHSYCHILDPLEHHNIDDELPDEGENGEMDSRDHNSDNWDPPENHNSNSESDTDEKHEKLRQLCPECGMFFYSQAHTCEYKKPCSCIVCGKRFLDEVHLKIHSKIHQDGYKHVCKYCCSTFRIRHEKLVHEQSHLPAEKPYQCPDCPEVFAKMRERSDHLVSHRGPKRHICLICNMEFSKKCKLERHVVVHTKAKAFVCEVCQHSFTQSSHLKSHMCVHTGEKPYQCQHCDKSFNHNVSLKSHIQRYHGQVPDPGMKVQMEKTSRNESETEKNETNEMETSAADAEEAEKSKDTLCNAKNGGDEEEEEKKEDKCTKKCKSYRPTGRPRGRPKKNAVITLEDANQLKRLLCISDEKVQGNSDSTDEEQEHDSDPIFEPVKRRTKKKGGAQSHKVRGRCRGKQK